MANNTRESIARSRRSMRCMFTAAWEYTIQLVTGNVRWALPLNTTSLTVVGWQDFRIGRVRKIWRYFPENQPILKIFTKRMFDDGSEIMPRQFDRIDIPMLREKCKLCNFFSIAKVLQFLRTGLEIISMKSSWWNRVSNCFPLAGTIQVLRSKIIRRNAFFRGGCLSSEICPRKLRQIGMTVCST